MERECRRARLAWANSLFEDNAEFGLGFRLAAIKHQELARQMANVLADQLPKNLVKELIEAPQDTESQIQKQIARVNELKRCLETLDTPHAKNLMSVADQLIRRSIWIVGGDGWAYDIGSSGLNYGPAVPTSISSLWIRRCTPTPVGRCPNRRRWSRR